MKYSYISVTLVCALLTACGRPVPHFAILLDASGSRGAVCSQVAGLGGVVLAHRGTKKGPTLSLLATGDASTSMEPRLLTTLQVPVSTRVLDGARQRSMADEAFLHDLDQACRQAAQPTEASPVFLGVKRAVELLKERCQAGAGCALLVNTDGEERAENSIKAAINGDRRARSRFPAPIENAGIRISFCGLASTVGSVRTSTGGHQYSPARDPARADRIRDVWTSLFTEPAAVGLHPSARPLLQPIQHSHGSHLARLGLRRRRSHRNNWAH